MDSSENGEKEAKDHKTEQPAIILKLKKSSYLKQYGCTVCPCSYAQVTNLKYHIRRDHFQLIAKVTKRDQRKINDVWLERVVNSDDVIEIKKTGDNKYLMKKSMSNADLVEVMEPNDTVDLTSLYPDSGRSRMRRVLCSICKKKFLRADYHKHLEKEHDDLML